MVKILHLVISFIINIMHDFYILNLSKVIIFFNRITNYYFLSTEWI